MKKNAIPSTVFFAYVFSITAAWLLDTLPTLIKLSTSKIILASLVTVLTLATFSLLAISLLTPNFGPAFLHRLDRLITPKQAWKIWSVGIFAFALSGYVFLSSNALFGAYSIYLTPMAAWVWGVCGGSLLLMFSRRADWSILAAQKDTLRPASLSLLIFLLLWAAIALTRIGLTADVAWWSETGTPILMTQALLAWIIGCAALVVSRIFPPFKQSPLPLKALDAILCLLIWLTTFSLWQSIPVRQDHFITRPVPPNFEYYPYSDALLYDLSAQQLLLGEGVSRASATKPLYAAFLALAHAVAGQNYARTASFQTAVLAFIPALLYLLTKSLSNRPAGLVAALLAMMRERNSLLLTDTIKVSSSKMFMSDMPAMAAMLLLTLLIVWWLQKPEKRPCLPLVIGGALGIFSLLRGQILFIAPLVLLIGMFAFWKRLQMFKTTLPLLVLGLTLGLLPWLAWKSWTSGQIGLNETMPRPTNIAYKYTLVDTACDPDMTPQACNARARKLLTDFILTYPRQTASFISAHFVHNIIESVLYLPPGLCIETPEELVTRLPLWDYRWHGELPFETLALLAINLTLIALGIGAAWSRHKHTVLIPFVLYLGYILTVSIARTSGYRFILPVDWVSLVFYAIGLMQATHILAAMLIPSLAQPTVINRQADESPKRLTWKSLLTASLFLLVLGALLPLAEMLIPQQFPPLTSKDEAITLYQSLTAEKTSLRLLPPETIAAFLDQEQGVVLYGRALYPRYFRNADKEEQTGAASQPYLLFYIAGPTTSAVILPLNAKPAQFPNASKAFILGCWETGELRDIPKYLEAKFVILPQEEQTFLSPSARQIFSCSK